MKIGFDRILYDWNEEEGISEIVSVCRKTGASSVWYRVSAALNGVNTRETVSNNIKRFTRIQKTLHEAGLEAGIHFNSIGYSERGQAYSDEFQHILGANGRECRAAFCPLDPDFQKYVAEVIGELAETAPDFIAVLMDDLHLQKHFPASGGCICPRHIKFFGELTGRRISAEEIVAGMKSGYPDALWIKKAFYDCEKETLVRHVRNIRTAINAVNQDIPMTIVNSHAYTWPFTGKLLAVAAEGSRSKPRHKYHAGIYMKDNKDLTPRVFGAIAFQLRMEPPGENSCWEADICPYHRFSISTSTLRALITGVRLLGVPDLWCTMGAHCKILSKAKTCAPFLEMYDRNKSFFAEVDRTARGIEWQGPATMFDPKVFEQIGWNENCGIRANPVNSGWQSVLGSLAIPHQVGQDSPVKMLTGNIAPLLSKNEIEKALHGSLLLDGGAAELLCETGLAGSIGANVHSRRHITAGIEKFLDLPEINRESSGEYMGASHPPESVKIIDPLSEHTVSASCFLDASGSTLAEPSLVLFENSFGGRVATYAYDLTGGPHPGFVGAVFPYLFKNDDRREQLIGVLEWLSGGQLLPAVTRSGVEMYMMYGRKPESGEDIMALFNSCYDPVNPLEIRFGAGVPKKSLLLGEGGNWKNIEPVTETAGRLKYDIIVPPMQPCLMRLIF